VNYAFKSGLFEISIQSGMKVQRVFQVLLVFFPTSLSFSQTIDFISSLELSNILIYFLNT